MGIEGIARKLAVIHASPAPEEEKFAYAPVPLPPLAFEQAAEWEDVSGAFSLVHDKYVKQGLIERNPVGLRYSHYNLLRESATFVAKTGERVIATFSLILDSKTFGLPMDELYVEELAELRNKGRRVAEISGLAVSPQYKPISIHLIMNLVKMLITYARKLGVCDVVMACHPRHARLYRRIFLFSEFGALKSYRSVNNAPAVALRFNLQEVEAVYRDAYDGEGLNLYRFLFSDEIFRCPEAALRAGAFTPDVVRHLWDLAPLVDGSLRKEYGDVYRPGLREAAPDAKAPSVLRLLLRDFYAPTAVPAT